MRMTLESAIRICMAFRDFGGSKDELTYTGQEQLTEASEYLKRRRREKRLAPLFRALDDYYRACEKLNRPRNDMSRAARDAWRGASIDPPPEFRTEFDVLMARAYSAKGAAYRAVKEHLAQ